jgi:hypothetical protein
MRAESVAILPKCAECEALWLPADKERWSAYLTDDEPPELAFFCAVCAERESGEHRTPHSITRRSSYAGTGWLKPFISNSAAG